MVSNKTNDYHIHYKEALQSTTTLRGDAKCKEGGWSAVIGGMALFPSEGKYMHFQN